MTDTREFKDKAGARDLGDPATDLPLTLRVGPRDNPHDPDAMRVIKSDETDGQGWHRITGPLVGEWMSDEEVACWPYTSMTVAGAAFLPPDPHHGLDVDYDDPLGPWAKCSCGDQVPTTRKYDAAEWWREHRRKARAGVAQAAERGDMDAEAFKG